MIRARRACGLLLMLGGLLYSLWLLEFLLPTRVSPVSSYVSELGADGEPMNWLFRAGDTLTGSALLGAGLLALVLRRDDERVPRPERITFGLLSLFGAATVLDSLCPMSCVATRDAACAAREAAGELPWTHVAHGITSGVAGFALWAAFVVLLWRGQAARRWLGQRTRWVITGLFGLWMLAMGVTLAMHLPGVSVALLGVSQRLELLLASCLLVVLGWRRWHTAHRA